MRRTSVTSMCASFLSIMLFVCLAPAVWAQPVENLVAFSASEAKKLEKVMASFQQEINPRALSGIVVAPTKTWPGRLRELPSSGALIGFLYTSDDLRRFGLKSGTYAMRLYSSELGTWQVDFLNQDNAAVSTVPVKIVGVKERVYEEPKAFITFSSPGVVICWDSVCVDI